MTQKVQEAGFAARTLLMFTWSNQSGQGKALREDVLRDAVDIEGVAKDLLGDEAQAIKGKGKAATTNETGVSKKLPKWLGKFTKK
jgi:hypothetical protein